ncbi:hypothetical protein STIUS_v1c05060 [Spiroplasma sp. TIUS-1]|uniref:hypothetical protein n=1 Tax=Spiroplasma sp. TIUS-1 TaxID=216963 RepID=UPI001398E940|nr:hypothetical protein [Spiroplasma sp. TIUS-1]QHX36060.1 hypothetical protein STIUS_v1c05060 [Spiroplasma sp. TIUS-1]
MKKLLVSLAFLGTGTIVGAATLPAIVSCVPITHNQILQQQINKDYVSIFREIENKYKDMSDEKIKSTFMNFVFPKNKKMNMTHGYDVMQWNTIITYTEDENNGFKRDLIEMNSLKSKLGNLEEYEALEYKKIKSMKNFMIYDEILRIMATDFNKYNNIFRSFSETRLVNEATGKNTEWSSNTSTTLDLKEYYTYIIDRLANNNALIPEEKTIQFSRSLPLNPNFEKALALIVSFKNATVVIDKNNNSDKPIPYRTDGMITWLNGYWKASFELGFLPESYKSKSGSFNDEIIRTNQMEIFRTELFNQSVLPVKSKYYHIEHNVDIADYLDNSSNIDNHPARWMNPKDLIDYYSAIINPITIYGLSNSLLRTVKLKKEIINEPGISMNLKFSNYLIENIHYDHWNMVLDITDPNRGSQFGGETKYLNINNKDGGKSKNRFLNSNQVDLSVDYKNVIKV